MTHTEVIVSTSLLFCLLVSLGISVNMEKCTLDSSPNYRLHRSALRLSQGKGLSSYEQIPSHRQTDKSDYTQPLDTGPHLPYSLGSHGMMYLYNAVLWTPPVLPTGFASKSVYTKQTEHEHYSDNHHQDKGLSDLMERSCRKCTWVFLSYLPHLTAQ